MTDWTGVLQNKDHVGAHHESYFITARVLWCWRSPSRIHQEYRAEMLCTLQLFVVKTGSLASVLRKSLGTVLAEQCTKTEEPSVCEHIVSSTDACSGCGRTRCTFPNLVGIQPAQHYREAPGAIRYMIFLLISDYGYNDQSQILKYKNS